MRLLSGMHEVLLAHPGGRGKTPGEVRRSQVWIGGTRPGNAAFVPPPASKLAECLKPFERFLNDEATALTAATVNKSLAHLERLDIVGELTSRQRGRVFGYRRYVDELTAELGGHRQ